VVALAAADVPTARRDSRGGETAAVHRDNRPVGVERCVVVVAEADRPAGCRRRSGNREVTSERDEHTGPGKPVNRGGHGVRSRGLGGGAEIELDAGRNADLEKLRVQSDASPAGRAVRDGDEAPVASANGDEGAVVACEAKRAADGRVDEPAGAARDVHRERDGFEETAGNANGLAGAGVQGGELGVMPEAAGEQVDRAERPHELASRTRKRRRIGYAQDGTRPERP
jgi:hypothetical protein